MPLNGLPQVSLRVRARRKIFCFMMMMFLSESGFDMKKLLFTR